MESITPVEQIIDLFDITALVKFYVVAAGVILMFVLAKKAFSMALGFINGLAIVDSVSTFFEARVASERYNNGFETYTFRGQTYNIHDRFDLSFEWSDFELEKRREDYKFYEIEKQLRKNGELD